MIAVADIGTTNLKTALFEKSTLLGLKNNSLIVNEFMETNAENWFNIFIESLKKLLNEYGKNKKLDSIIISGNGPTLVPYPSNKAYLWLDRRSEKEGEEVSNLLGFQLDCTFLLPKILWLKRNRREEYDNAEYFLGSADYLNYRLTGKAYTLQPLEKLEKWYWNTEFINKLNLDEKKFPTFIGMGKQIGLLTTEIATDLNVEKVPVISGCIDFVSSILGSGVCNVGQLCDRSGTSEGLNFCSADYEEIKGYMCYRHPNGIDWNISRIISTSGKAIQKMKDLLNIGNGNFSSFYELASKSSPGANGVIFIPYLSGSRDMEKPVNSSLIGLNLNTTKSDIARSVIEGICFAIKEAINPFKSKLTEIIVTGGGGINPFMNQLKADILGVPVKVRSDEESDLLGLVVINEVALGKYQSIKNASEELITRYKIYNPNLELTKFYDTLFQSFLNAMQES